ncbi:MAG: hypothetical protein AB1861_09960 [Cyanobacteriota bacterium]
MTFSYIWENTTPEELLGRILSLPTLPWARPVLPQMGLPNALVEQPEIWASIHASAVVEHQRRCETKDWAVGTPDGWRHLLRQVVTKALQKLASEMGRDVAINLERWVMRHFLCRELNWTMYIWYLVLDTACELPNFDNSMQIPPPAVLVLILPEIGSIVNYERWIEFESTLKQISQPPSQRLQKVLMGQAEVCSEAMTISNLVKQVWTIKALQIIAENLNEIERAEVVGWAQLQAKKLKYNPDALKGDKYLRVEPPCFDAPSVLDLPATDESRLDGRRGSGNAINE